MRLSAFLSFGCCIICQFQLLAQLVSTTSGGPACNPLVKICLKRCISYFNFPILSAIVGSLTCRNISMLQGVNIRQPAQRHLPSMMLLQIVCLTIEAVPYGTYYVYAATSSTTVKEPDRAVIENLFFQIVNIFFVYLISSETFRG
jgi:hypothetical protein